MTLELSELGDCAICHGTGLVIFKGRKSRLFLERIGEPPIEIPTTIPARPCFNCPAGAIEAKLLDELPGDDRGSK